MVRSIAGGRTEVFTHRCLLSYRLRHSHIPNTIKIGEKRNNFSKKLKRDYCPSKKVEKHTILYVRDFFTFNLIILLLYSCSGYVDENSEVGTKVVDENGKDIVFVVNDADRGQVRDRP